MLINALSNTVSDNIGYNGTLTVL